MASWTFADVRALAPELAALTEAQIDAAIARAVLVVSEDFGDRESWAGALMTAHLLTLFPPVAGSGGGAGLGGAGAVSSRTVGQVSVAYAVPVTSGSVGLTLERTSYGQQFARLAQLTFAGPLVL